MCLAALDQGLVVVHQHLWLGHNPPIQPRQEFQLQKSQLFDAHTAHPRVCLVRPEAVAEAFACHGRRYDQEAMYCEARDRKGWVERAEAVDVVDDAQEDRWGESGMYGDAL